jgi:hypothetical protein
MKLLPLLCALVIAHAALGTEEDLPKATLVVYNPNYPESKSLAEYYAHSAIFVTRSRDLWKTPISEVLSRLQIQTQTRD